MHGIRFPRGIQMARMIFREVYNDHRAQHYRGVDVYHRVSEHLVLYMYREMWTYRKAGIGPGAPRYPRG